MKPENLIFIEQELNISLPDSYKKEALDARISLTRHPTRFYDDPKKVISMNQRLRKKGIYGQSWRGNHFAFGYDRDGGEYYFIDLNQTDGNVYIANRSKSWRYSPDDISNNSMRMYSTIAKYVDYMCFLDNMVRNSVNRPPEPELTEEENRTRIALLLREIAQGSKSGEE